MFGMFVVDPKAFNTFVQHNTSVEHYVSVRTHKWRLTSTIKRIIILLQHNVQIDVIADIGFDFILHT